MRYDIRSPHSHFMGVDFTGLCSQSIKDMHSAMINTWLMRLQLDYFITNIKLGNLKD